MVIFFHLTCPDLKIKKDFNFLVRVSGAGTETSLCMKEVSFWAVKDITRNDSAREERNEIPHYNAKLTLKLKCCLIYYNRRYRSVY